MNRDQMREEITLDLLYQEYNGSLNSVGLLVLGLEALEGEFIDEIISGELK